jgi:N-methylhydantoinase B
MDPITFEILRHRLWMINDEQGKIAVRISGSPLVYDVKDFSASLLAPTGDSLFIGPHVTRLSIALHATTKTVLRECHELGFNDGDMFFTNDPWAGTAHHNDQAVVAPVVWHDEVVCWTGIAMHDPDVGGPTYGGFSVVAADAYSEPPLVPPIKLVERGEIRPDLERLVLRNSRTPELNALNLRSRIAAQNVARQRIVEIIEEYGKDALLDAQQQIIAMTRRAIARRLAELPDGQWRAQRIIDHNGFENHLYKIQLTMTKHGDRLTFDFTGTDKQARGTINCAPGGLEGGVYSAILPMLCYDMAWCPAAIQQCVTIISEPGTLNSASYPAAIGTATVSAIWATGDAVRACLARMLACSEKYLDEAQATWSPGLMGASVSGTSRAGAHANLNASVRVGASGATGTHDGLDGGGTPGAPTLTMENVEAAETYSQIGLILYRKIQPATAGAGKYRGGAGVETLIAPHDVTDPLIVAQYSQGPDHPLSKGVWGGYPSSVQGSVILRNAEWPRPGGAPDIPGGLDEIACERNEVVPAKGVRPLNVNDLVISWSTGGSGFGDPLERAEALVARDVERLAVTPEMAARLYGVVVDAAGRVDAKATADLRRRLREERLANATPVTMNGARANGTADGATPLLTLGDAVHVVGANGSARCVCARCGFEYGPADVDPKLGASYRDRHLEDISPLNRFAASRDAFVLREVFCPGCALLIGTEVMPPDREVHSDTELALATATVP